VFAQADMIARRRIEDSEDSDGAGSNESKLDSDRDKRKGYRLGNL
jgi:hypothetical protein